MLEIDATTADASGAEPMFLMDGTPAGQVSSGAYGYSVGKSLAIAYLKAGLAKPGDTVQVAILGQPHTARVLAARRLTPKACACAAKAPGRYDPFATRALRVAIRRRRRAFRRMKPSASFWS